MTRNLTELLDEASAHVAPVDFAERAWAAAAARRREVSRRSVLGLAAGAAGVATFAVIRDRGGRATPPGAAQTPTGIGTGLPAGAELDSVTVAGRTAWIMPTEAEAAELPWLSLGLPERAADPGTLPHFSANPSARLSVVFLDPVGKGRFDPVLDVGLGPERSSYEVHPFADVNGVRIELGPRTVHPDGTQVVFAEQGWVHVHDLKTNLITRIGVADRGLVHAGWSIDNERIVAWSDSRGWLVDPRRDVEEVKAPVYDGHYRLTTGRGGATVLESHSADGLLSGSTPLSLPVASFWGPTASALTGWAAAGMALTTEAASELAPWWQGAIAVNADVPSSWRLLVAPDDVGAAWQKGACVALGWASQDIVLLAAYGQGVAVLAWDVVAGRMWRVSDLSNLIDLGSGHLMQGLALGPVHLPA
jgi:hypothetical protein